MLTSVDFFLGFLSCSLLVLLYLLYELIQLFRELVSILKEELKGE